MNLQSNTPSAFFASLRYNMREIVQWRTDAYATSPEAWRKGGVHGAVASWAEAVALGVKPTTAANLPRAGSPPHGSKAPVENWPKPGLRHAIFAGLGLPQAALATAAKWTVGAHGYGQDKSFGLLGQPERLAVGSAKSCYATGHNVLGHGATLTAAILALTLQLVRLPVEIALCGVTMVTLLAVDILAWCTDFRAFRPDATGPTEGDRVAAKTSVDQHLEHLPPSQGASCPVQALPSPVTSSSSSPADPNRPTSQLPVGLERLPRELQRMVFAALIPEDGTMQRSTLQLRTVNKATQKLFDEAMPFASQYGAGHLRLYCQGATEDQTADYSKIKRLKVTNSWRRFDRWAACVDRLSDLRHLSYHHEDARLWINRNPAFQAHQPRLTNNFPRHIPLASLCLSATTYSRRQDSDAAELQWILNGNVTQLEHLELRGLNLTNSQDSTFSNLSQARLKSLTIDNSQLDDRGLAALLRVDLPRLNHLELVSNDLTESGLAAFASLSRASLKTLSIKGSRITDRGIEHLAAATDFAPSRLAFGGTQMTHAGLANACTRWQASLLELDVRRESFDTWDVQRAQEQVEGRQINILYGGYGSRA